MPRTCGPSGWPAGQTSWPAGPTQRFLQNLGFKTLEVGIARHGTQHHTRIG
jgi:hypothetical protein